MNNNLIGNFHKRTRQKLVSSQIRSLYLNHPQITDKYNVSDNAAIQQYRIHVNKLSTTSQTICSYNRPFHTRIYCNQKNKWNVERRFSNTKQALHVQSEPVSATIKTKKAKRPLRPYSIINDIDIIKEIPLEDYRNFTIIAHIDHGKSSLASRLLELTGNLGIESQYNALKHAGLITDGDSNDTSKEFYEYFNDSENPKKKSLSKIDNDKEKIEILDTLSVERERGITVKASATSMLYSHPSATNKHGLLLLNMFDSPGHVDFGTEVTRCLMAVQGAVLLFDAAQGIQAQSLSVHEKAKSMENVKTIIPVLTKVDLPSARPLDVALSVSELFHFDPDDVILTSARNRRNIKQVLDKVSTDVPPPQMMPDDDDKTLRAQVVDSWYETSRGVICLVQILSGELTEGARVSVLEPTKPSSINHDIIDKLDEDPLNIHLSRTQNISDDIITHSLRHGFKSNKEHYSVQEIGIVVPQRLRTGTLGRGQMGYVIVGLRDPRQARPGTILVLQNDASKVLDNMYLPVPSRHSSLESSVLYASVHPLEGDGFDELASAVDRLALNDMGLEVNRTSGIANNNHGGPYLGPGLRVGFQGLLHVEVFRQRLLDEFQMEAIVTPPKVPYKITYLPSKSYKRADDAPTEEIIEDISRWPPSSTIRFKVEEPVVTIRIMSPSEYAGNIMELIKRKRGTDMDTKPIDESTWLFTAKIPWGEVVTDFHDELKNTTAGYASFDSRLSESMEFKEASLCKVEIMLNGEVVEPLSFVSHRDLAQGQGRKVCKKLQEVLPRQQFVTVIQAKADSKIIASERIRAFRKDVLTTGGSKAVGGGDVTRKKKLLEKQKAGKKRQQTSGRVTLSQEAFNSVISRAK